MLQESLLYCVIGVCMADTLTCSICSIYVDTIFTRLSVALL